MFVFYGENNGFIPPNPRMVGYIDPIHGPLDGPLYMGSHIQQHPPQSKLPAQRCSRLDKKRVQRVYKGKIPPQPQLATCYVEAGAKLREGRGGWSFGEDVSKLGGSRDMEYPNIADCDSVAHEV